MRWREGQLMQMGGQTQISSVIGGVETYKFASTCKKIHGWYDGNQVYHIAYLCERHLYVDTGGVLANITPVDGIAPPTGIGGGYGDGFYRLGSSPDSRQRLWQCADDRHCDVDHQDPRRL